MPETWRLGTGEERARVAVVGCGGAGCNILRAVRAPPNAERVAINDAPHPAMVGLSRRAILRSDSLRAFASMDEKAVMGMETEEEKAIVSRILDRDLVLILGGLGGELGGWAMSLVGRVARILGDASLALATTPFSAEGSVRRQVAEAQLDLLRRKVDALVTFANDRLLAVARDLPMVKALSALGTIIAGFASDLANVVSRGDVVPLRRLLAGGTNWRFGMGAGKEKHRCFLAVEDAYGSPWFAARPEDLRRAIVLVRQPFDVHDEQEILRQVRLRSPRVEMAWAPLPIPMPEDRVAVLLLAGSEVPAAAPRGRAAIPGPAPPT